MVHTNSLPKTSSWVIVDILTDDVIKETLEKQEVEELNIKGYKAITTLTVFKSKSLYMRLLLLLVVNR